MCHQKLTDAHLINLFVLLKTQYNSVVGAWAADGSSPNHTYDFQDSKSCVDGVFYGLPLDYDNEDDLSEPRIEEWVAQVQAEL